MAEAPRKQYAQVGDSSSTKRERSAESLNCRLKSSRLLGVNEVSGAWPGGVRLNPQKYQPTNDARTTKSNKPYFRFLFMTESSARYQARNDLRKQNNYENHCGGDPEQHDAEHTAFLALIATAIQLHKTDHQKDRCEGKEPRAIRPRPKAQAR